MAWTEVIWTDGPDGNLQHLAEHGVTPDEVEHDLAHPIESDVSESSGRPVVFGYTAGGRFLAVVYEQIDAITVYPITAFEVEE
jgi:uncharacterized DUF497 family protein